MGVEKRCFKCLCVKAIDLFYKHAAMRDGRLNKCIDCTKADAIKHRLENLERVRAYDRSRGNDSHRVAARRAYSSTAAGAKRHAEASQRWSERNPERKRASTAVNAALRRGKLKRLPCLVCGDEKSEGHHPDYSAPLSVVWLCDEHHKAAHRATKEAEECPA